MALNPLVGEIHGGEGRGVDAKHVTHRVVAVAHILQRIFLVLLCQQTKQTTVGRVVVIGIRATVGIAEAFDVRMFFDGDRA